MFWMALGVAWLVWWLRRPLFIPRYNMLKAGQEDELVTKTDVTIAKSVLIGVPIIVLLGYVNSVGKYEETIPLQTSVDLIDPLPKTIESVKAKVKRAEYNVAERAMKLIVNVNNQGDQPVRLGELTTGSVRFVNTDVVTDTGDYPAEYLAKNGLEVTPSAAIYPGESAKLNVIAQDAAWEIEHLSSVIRDTDSRFGGLLFFFDDDGNRYLTSVSSPIIPQF